MKGRMEDLMPVTIISSDLAYADLESGRLALHYTGEEIPPRYLLVLQNPAGEETERLGPFEHEDEAIDEAVRRYGRVTWSRL